MWAYESHLGGLYFEDERVSTRDLYCDQCDDSDEELGDFDSAVKFIEYYAPRISVDGYGIYPLDDILRALKLYFDDVPDYDKAVEIVRANREVDGE